MIDGHPGMNAAAPPLRLPAALLLCSALAPLLASASRAYPHGCLHRHPSYYTYDERDDTPWADSPAGAEVLDFRRLPPRSSGLRRWRGGYRPTRRLGAGKFSQVFEAVDLQREFHRVRADRRRRVREDGGESSGGGETTDATETEDEADGVNTGSLVVLKCLKPVSERKVRRELLILTHCETLPNLARLEGIVLPESMDEDDEGEGEKPLQQKVHPMKRRRHHHDRLQLENIGCITDAASVEVDRQRKRNIGCITDAASVEMDRQRKSNAPKLQSNPPNPQSNNQCKIQLPAFVLEHAGRESRWFCHGTSGNHLTEYDMKYYLCHLLIALDGLHAAGIMHRDVKPRNTLINNVGAEENRDFEAIGNQMSSFSLHETKQESTSPQPLMLVDLGLADFYLPGKEYNVRVASRHYKSPELLIGFEYYDYAIDMWSAGCMLAGLLFRREPFFRGKDNEDQLGRIVSVLGTRDFLPYCRRCGVRLSSRMRAAIGEYCSRASTFPSSSSDGEALSLRNNDMSRRRPWSSFLDPDCPVPSPEALDLLDRLLVYDHEQRWTAREALGHPFFDEVRERVVGEVRRCIASEGRWRRPH